MTVYNVNYPDKKHVYQLIDSGSTCLGFFTIKREPDAYFLYSLRQCFRNRMGEGQIIRGIEFDTTWKIVLSNMFNTYG